MRNMYRSHFYKYRICTCYWNAAIRCTQTSNLPLLKRKAYIEVLSTSLNLIKVVMSNWTLNLFCHLISSVSTIYHCRYDIDSYQDNEISQVVLADANFRFALKRTSVSCVLLRYDLLRYRTNVKYVILARHGTYFSF